MIKKVEKEEKLVSKVLKEKKDDLKVEIKEEKKEEVKEQPKEIKEKDKSKKEDEKTVKVVKEIKKEEKVISKSDKEIKEEVKSEIKENFIIPSKKFADEIINAGGGTVFLCFQCGTCTGSCPSGRHTAFQTRKLVRMTQLGLREDVLKNDDIWLCTTCYTCYDRCPRGVEITDIIMTIRNLAVKEGNIAEQHKKTLSILIKTGHLIPIDDNIKTLREKLGLEKIPKTVLANEKAKKEVQRIIAITGLDKLVGGA